MSEKESKTISKSFRVKPKDFIYEDDVCFIFDEIADPQAPIHYVVVPKKHLRTLCDATVEDEKILGHLLTVATNVAVSRGLHKSGYHVVVKELHTERSLRSVHVFGRALQHMIWPTGPGARL